MILKIRNEMMWKLVENLGRRAVTVPSVLWGVCCGRGWPPAWSACSPFGVQPFTRFPFALQSAPAALLSSLFVLTSFQVVVNEMRVHQKQESVQSSHSIESSFLPLSVTDLHLESPLPSPFVRWNIIKLGKACFCCLLLVLSLPGPPSYFTLTQPLIRRPISPLHALSPLLHALLPSALSAALTCTYGLSPSVLLFFPLSLPPSFLCLHAALGQRGTHWNCINSGREGGITGAGDTKRFAEVLSRGRSSIFWVCSPATSVAPADNSVSWEPERDRFLCQQPVVQH